MKRFFIFIFPVFIFSCSGNQDKPVVNSADSSSVSNVISVDSIKKTSIADSSLHTRPIIGNIDELAKMVFDAVKSNSVKDYLNLLPTMEEINALMAVAKLDAQTKELSLKEFPEKRKREEEKAKEHFAEAVKQAIDSGIQWNETKFFIAKTSVQMTPAGFEQANDVSVIFSYGTKYYALRLADCIKTPSGWRLSSRIRYDWQPVNPAQ